jgi:1-deoxy-D-xylulose-5-phosphate synthase
MELFEEEGLEGVAVVRFGYPDRYLEQGEQHDLRAACGLDAAGIAAGIRKALNR